MPAAKTKSAPANGAGPKVKAAKTPSSSNGAASPTPKAVDTSEPNPVSTGGSGKPDKAAHDAELEKIKVEIDALQLKLHAVKDKISLGSKSGPGNDRKTAIRAEMDSIRGQQSSSKQSRGKILDQLKAIQESVQKKTKDLNAARSKIPFKTVAEVDAHIKNLDRQVESGNMKLAEEKRALQEISQTKRSRRTVEGFQAEQDSIDADRNTADELRKQLDDPEAKAASERWEALQAELDQIKKEGDEAYADRNKLYEERDALQAEVNTLYTRRRDVSQTFREANDRYWNKVNEDRARRAERARAQRAAEEAEKKKAVAERLREEASAPAFQAQMEDCQTLVDYFSGTNSGNTYSSASLVTKSEVAGVPKLELRKIDAVPEEGLIVHKKKNEEEESYFVGGKGKSKGKKSRTKANASEADNTSSSSSLNIPLATLSALLSLAIPPPASPADIPRVVEDLKTKKAWYEANQKRVTAENIAKAELDIQRITNGKSDSKVETSPAPSEITPPNGGGEHPAEPAPTQQSPDVVVVAVPSEEVVEKLEDA